LLPIQINNGYDKLSLATQLVAPSRNTSCGATTVIGQVADSFTRFLSLMRLNVLSVAHNGM